MTLFLSGVFGRVYGSTYLNCELAQSPRMSDERSVEARLLAFLTLNPASLIDHSADSAYWSDSSEAVVPEHITAALQNAAEFSHSPELRRLARLGLAISKKVRIL